MNQNNNSPELVGSINLSDLLYAQVNTQGNQSWLMIPIQQNPALFMTFDKQSGKPKVALDISIWRNANPKFGNTHYIRASVGRKNGENLNEEQRRAASMILGNARAPKNEGQQQPQYPQQGSPAMPAPPQMGGYAQQPYNQPYPQQPQQPGPQYPQQGGFPPQGPQGPAFGGGYQPMPGAPINPDDLP